MNIAYRFRIYPNREQEVLLAKTFGCCRFLYNQMLNDKIREYEATKKMLRNTPAMYKKTYPFLKGPRSPKIMLISHLMFFPSDRRSQQRLLT